MEACIDTIKHFSFQLRCNCLFCLQLSHALLMQQNLMSIMDRQCVLTATISMTVLV